MEAYQQLEREFGRWASVENVVACNSGTAALHLALESLQLPLGSEVLIPDFTMIACARAVTLAGLKPVFIDCRDDLLINPDLIRARCEVDGGKAEAIMPVHIYGRRCDMHEIHKVAKDYDLFVIEDLAEAHGVPPHPDTDAACWSFYRNKIIHGEEGGAVAFRSPHAAETARSLRCLGFTSAHDFTHLPRGHNYRMSNLHAEAILRSLHVVEGAITSRKEIERWYDARCPLTWKMPPRKVPWVYDICLPPRMQEEAVRRLRAVGVEARYGFKRMATQPEYLHGPTTVTLSGTVIAEGASKSIIYLPIQPGITGPREVGLAFESLAELAHDISED